jgi:hypothetical protein
VRELLLVLVAAVYAAVTGILPAQVPAEPGSAGTGAPTLLQRLTVMEPIEDLTYDRDEFGSGWGDLDHDGCNTREEVMFRDLLWTEREDGCNVVEGTLRDPYASNVVRYDEAVDPQAVQIDHVYPLKRAWLYGAREWKPEKRKRFANDPLNLLAVDGPTNGRKSDQGPETWLLPVNPNRPLAKQTVLVNRAYECSWSRRYVQVAWKWRLGISPRDEAVLANTLERCRGRR